MVKKLSESAAKATLGVAGDNTSNGQIRADEFLPELRGKKAIRKYREMRDFNIFSGLNSVATSTLFSSIGTAIMRNLNPLFVALS